MASSFSLSAVPTTNPLSSRKSRSPLFSKPNSSRQFKVSCNANPSADENPKKLILPQNVDRRNVLLGLGGLYGAANIGSASAFPVTTPDDLSKCVDSTLTGDREPIRTLACCPPVLSPAAPRDYVLPPNPEMHFRKPITYLTREEVDRYKRAVKALKDLDDDHPHSWKQQAKIHCAYCNGGYKYMSGNEEKVLSIHLNSLFFPFHRWYLYFLEKIMGTHIQDPTFRLPFWQWDHPIEMTLPAVLEEADPDSTGRLDPRNNPLFDAFRDFTHLPPAIVQLPGRNDETTGDQVRDNLTTMYKQMITNAPTKEAFFGRNPGTAENTAGTVEAGVHTRVHVWVGNPRMPFGEDMGNFYSAGYDPAFYLLHGNVDRLWDTWILMNPSQPYPTDSDWRDSSYVFYDENLQLVRVYNRDCLNSPRMGYGWNIYADEWPNYPPTPRVTASNIAAKSVGVVKKAEEMEFPVKLDQTVNVLVKRPATKRSEEEKKKATEMLFLNGIQFNGEEYFELDVLVDDVDDGIETTASFSEFAGSFAQVPHNHGGGKMMMTAGATFGITKLLEDIEADDDEYVLVTLVPKAGGEDATLAGISIQLVPIEPTAGAKAGTASDNNIQLIPIA